jgi:hypothetical protein
MRRLDSLAVMRGLCVRLAPFLLAPVAVSGCGKDREDPDVAMSQSGITAVATDGGSGIADSADDGDDGGDKLDALGGATEGGVPCAEGGDCDECVAYEHVPCDSGTSNPFSAMGLNCPGEATVTASSMGNPLAMGVRTGFGSTQEWAPREGTAYAVIGSGRIEELDTPTPAGDSDVGPMHCNDDLDGLSGGAGDFGMYDRGGELPQPLRAMNVGGDCTADASLIGSGDCSNTIQAQYEAGSDSYDYTEVRIEAVVPVTNNSINYDFAFFSTEYPFYYKSAFNDMYVGWLESESWTGNISFDTAGNPISLNAGFLDFRDAQGGAINDPTCATGCSAPELHGTCMQQHAGTKWLQSSAPVTPGETITLVLAVFDLSDSILDSYVFLDNFGWGCEGDSTPSTKPVG